MDLTSNNLQWFMCHKTKPNRLGFEFESAYELPKVTSVLGSKIRNILV